MVKTIIACADIHIRNYNRQEEYVEQIKKFVSECKEIVSQHKSPKEVRIVVAGDIVHNKLDISGEGYTMASWFLHQLDDVAPTIFIAGNHDINMRNTNRIDPLTAICTMNNFKQVKYLDKELGYTSGYILDDNIVWCLYSAFDKFAAPNISEYTASMMPGNEDFADLFGNTQMSKSMKTCVGLFHGELKNAKTDVGFVFENGIPESHFEGVDFAIMGHIHKRQCIKYNGVPLMYCGSLIQQDQGENVSGHGYVVWNVKEQTYEEKDLENKDYGFYTFSISDISDIENNTEQVLNM